MTTVINGTVKGLQKRIVHALETGTDPAPILKELAELRAKIAAEGELAELQKAADERQTLKDKADAVKAKVQKQSDAIDRFLELRDTLVSQLQPLLASMEELAKMAAPTWEREPGECYIYNDIGVFAVEVRNIAKGYLPADFGCPFLDMAGGFEDARYKAPEAWQYLSAAYGILTQFTKGIRTVPLKPAEGLMAIDDEDETPSKEGTNCIVCSHANAEDINTALKEGKSLRAIEAEFAGVSRSTLQRHKKNCLGIITIGAVD